MALLKVFVSSTCYDLGIVRSKLQDFLRSIGCDPVLSEYSDVLYDHRVHTHTSCIDEVGNCDMLVLLIGARFGGKAVPEATQRVDLPEILKQLSGYVETGRSSTYSITQLEVLKAIELRYPVFAFVDERVLHDHLVYEKNKATEVADKIVFPSIEKQETAKFIFEFVNFLRLRNSGNAIIPFSRIDDIENHLRKQWSALFQRLLREDRDRTRAAEENRRIQQQLDDLRLAILSSIQAPKARDLARGVIRFRSVVRMMKALGVSKEFVASTNCSLSAAMKHVGVSRIVRVGKNDSDRPWKTTVYLIAGDNNSNSFVELRGIEFSEMTDLERGFEDFSETDAETRVAVFEAWEDVVSPRDVARRHAGDFERYVTATHDDGSVVQYFEPDNLRVPSNSRLIQSVSDDDIPF